MDIVTENTKQTTQPLAGTIKGIFQELLAEPKQKNSRLADGWAKIVGERIAKRTTPKFREFGVVIRTDDSVLAFELGRRYGAAILKRLQNEFGEEEVKKVWFCVGGNAQTE